MSGLIRDKQFAFTVEIDGIARAAFKTCTELDIELGELKLREGGVLVEHKEPGLAVIADVTLTRGKTRDKDFYDWMKKVVNMISGLGDSPSDDLKRTVDVVQRDRNGAEIGRYRLFEAWPKKRTIGPWDNDAEEWVMESIVLSIGYWDEL